VAEGGGLLNRYTVISRIGGSNPPPSASLLTRDILFVRSAPAGKAQDAGLRGHLSEPRAAAAKPTSGYFRLSRPTFSDATEPHAF
jgi:hypothetical protein